MKSAWLPIVIVLGAAIGTWLPRTLSLLWVFACGVVIGVLWPREESRED